MAALGIVTVMPRKTPDNPFTVCLLTPLGQGGLEGLQHHVGLEGLEDLEDLEGRCRVQMQALESNCSANPVPLHLETRSSSHEAATG